MFEISDKLITQNPPTGKSPSLMIILIRLALLMEEQIHDLGFVLSELR